MKYRMDRNFAPLLIAHIFEYWYYYLIAIASLFGLHSVQSLIPEMAKNLGDQLLNHRLDRTYQTWEFLGLALAVIVLRTMSRNLFFYPARVQQKHLRLEMFEQIEQTHPSLYHHQTDGNLYQIMANDINRIRSFVGFALLQVGNVVIAASIFLPKLSKFNPDFVQALLPLLISMIVFSLMVYMFHPYMKKDMDLMANIQHFIIESYEAKASIKNYHSEESFINAFNEHSNKQLEQFFKSSFGRILGPPMVKLGLGASLLWGAWIVYTQNLSASSLIFFSGFLYLILEPLMFMSWIGIVLSQGLAAWKRVKSVWCELRKETDFSWLDKQQLPHLAIPFWDKNIDIEIDLHKKMVIVGETGHGKSFLLGQIANFFWKSQYSYSFIPQNPYLYNDTIGNNIFLGKQATTQEKELAKELFVLFALDDLASHVDDLFDLEVGENGKKISGGQAKRVCLIRSLLSGVDIFLWDDPFSSVDVILEKVILEKLLAHPHFKDKTFIFTSHRLSTARFSDKIVYVSKEKGIIEQGPFKDLITPGNKIYEFFEKQMV